MLVNDKEVLARLNSPSNLISQIKSGFNNGSSRKNAMTLFSPSNKIPGMSVAEPKEESLQEIKQEIKEDKPQPPAIFTSPSESIPKEAIERNAELKSLDALLNENEAEIKLALAHNSALNLVEKTLTTLHSKVDSMKASDLPRVLASASKVVEGIRKERLEMNRQDKDREVHFHFYTPQQKSLSDYEVIDVDSTPAQG